jgi:hypothetical protein
MIILVGDVATHVRTGMELALDRLRRDRAATDETMFNAIAHFDGNRYVTILFPRTAHRPACYFASGPDRIAVSPAILEMCGILVVTEDADFARIDVDGARSIYEEVSANI